VGNPGLDVLDIPSVSDIAHGAGVPLLVDSTLTSPYLIKPFDHGADLVYHSATKFLSGHGTVIGGVVVDGGSFDWEKSGKFAELSQAYDGFHNMVFSEESTVGAFLLRARREGLRDFGASMSPHTAWLILQGIETLPLRMERHIDNTQKVVEFLAAHPFVSRVGHPLIGSHPSHALAKKLLKHGARGAGAVFSFDIKGSRTQGKAFIEALKLFSHLANVGDCRSLVIHPASTTHFRMTDEALAGAGISQGTIRLSIGLEDVEGQRTTCSSTTSGRDHADGVLCSANVPRPAASSFISLRRAHHRRDPDAPVVIAGTGLPPTRPRSGLRTRPEHQSQPGGALK
jgi:O-acetylhomoserine (thiol)-lyase